MFKKTVLALMVASLSTSCIPLVNGVSNLSTVEINEKTFSIKSTTNPNEIKKPIFLKERFIRDKGKPLSETRTFNLTQDDLKRRFILNIFNGSSTTERVSSATVKINGKDYAVQSDFNQNVSDMSFSIDNLKQGINTIEVKLNSKPNSSIDINIDGFLESYKIDGAIHSLIPRDAEMKKAEYKKGLFGIKFLEGTKVRLITDSNNNQKFVDLNGTSLEGLNKLLKTLQVKVISKSINRPDSELEQDESRLETIKKVDVPNLNLFFRLEINNNSDIWEITDKIKSLPYVEESYPYFVEKYPSSLSIPTDPQIIGKVPESETYAGIMYPNLIYKNTVPENSVVTHSFAVAKDKSDWLRFMHVMPNNKDAGAWSRTQGDPSIKSAVIGHGFQHSSLGLGQKTHEDLEDVLTINNVDKTKSTKPDIDLRHQTESVGIIGAKGNNGKGIAGISHKGTTYGIQSYGSASSACNGEGGTNCEPTIDSMYLAKKNGIKSIILEAWAPPNTIEQANSEIRALIPYFVVLDEISVIVPAGNASNNDIRLMQWKNEYGKDVTITTPDSGSIIVGGLSLDGSTRNSDNYGVSKAGGIDDLETFGGHGVDVSAPAEEIFTTSFDSSNPNDTNRYGRFGGTSGGSPAITGIVNLMYSLNPNLTPLEVRKILRDTRQKDLLLGNSKEDGSTPTAGMVDAWKALDKAKPFTITGIPSNNNFPNSITVNGVTTNLNYGYIFNPQSENDYKDYSPNNLGGVKLVRASEYSNLAQWINDGGKWGVDFSNSPYSAIEVPDGDYEFGRGYTTIALVKLKNDDSVNLRDNDGYILTKWWYGSYQDHCKINKLLYGKYDVLNTNQDKDPRTGNIYYQYVTNDKLTEANSPFILSESLDTLSNTRNIVKNQLSYSDSLVYPSGAWTNQIESVTNGRGRMFLGNFYSESYGWNENFPGAGIATGNLKGNLYGLAIIKQSLNADQIKEIHKQMGY